MKSTLYLKDYKEVELIKTDEEENFEPYYLYLSGVNSKGERVVIAHLEPEDPYIGVEITLPDGLVIF